ncbi:hypothetical protein KAR91_12310 [Candidatus Pacearchaeota archaeon]|nr:hypothetical protein [Candidatus Pacearchaeota archaeon]
MAIIIPFADPDAHGTIANSVTFRRRRGKVVFQKKPHGKQPNTPAQQAQKTKFSDGWIAYHQLSSWEIAYLEEKAAELNTTKANLFLSQWLLDEIPSIIPLNQIKEILNISLPEPEAVVAEGLLHEFFSQVDSPLVETLLGHIFDNENIVVTGSIAGAHDRSFIRIENKTAGEFIIPFNYPLILDYITQADITKTQLIRLPEITLPAPAVPSTTKLTNIKSIQGLSIVVTQQSGVEDVQIQLQNIVSGTVLNLIIGSISDNRNVSNEETVTTPNTDTYIEFADNKGTPIEILQGMEINLDWTDLGDVVHNDKLTLPAIQNDDGGVASTSGTNDMKDILDLKIKYPQEAGATDLNFVFQAAGSGGDVGVQLAGIQDNQNIFNDNAPATNYTVMSITMTNSTLANITLNEGYSLIVKYLDQASDTKMQTVVLPQTTIPASGSKILYLADDFSVYDEVGLSTLLLKGYINTKKLWIADDLSLYWDQALTNLASSPGLSLKEIFLASDFSTYFDVGLTQLGNTPFY